MSDTEQTPKIEWKWIKEENQFGSYLGVDVHVFQNLVWRGLDVKEEMFVWGYILEPNTKTRPWSTNLEVYGSAPTREEAVATAEILAERFVRAFQIFSDPF